MYVPVVYTYCTCCIRIVYGCIHMYEDSWVSFFILFLAYSVVGAAPPVSLPPTILVLGAFLWGHTLFNAWCDCQSSVGYADSSDMIVCAQLFVCVYLKYTSLLFVGVLFPLSAVNLCSLSLSLLTCIFISAPPTYHIINMHIHTHTHTERHVEQSSSSGPIVIASTCKLLFTLREQIVSWVCNYHAQFEAPLDRQFLKRTYTHQYFSTKLSINLWLSCP